MKIQNNKTKKKIAENKLHKAIILTNSILDKRHRAPLQ